MNDRRGGGGDDDYFSHMAKKFKPKTAYPDSRMKVYTKPEPKAADVEVEEMDTSNHSDTAIQRIIKFWKGD